MTLWIDWILACVAAEALLLAILHWRTGRGPAPASMLPSLGAGAMLLLSMRLVLGGAGREWVAGCLLAGLAGHLIDVRQRWPQRPRARRSA